MPNTLLRRRESHSARRRYARLFVESVKRGQQKHFCERVQGIFITRVADDGPSSLAGLRAGDRLLSVGLHHCCFFAVACVRLIFCLSVCLTGAGKTIPVYNQPPRSTQPGRPSVGRRNEYT